MHKPKQEFAVPDPAGYFHLFFKFAKTLVYPYPFLERIVERIFVAVFYLLIAR